MLNSCYVGWTCWKSPDPCAPIPSGIPTPVLTAPLRGAAGAACCSVYKTAAPSETDQKAQPYPTEQQNNFLFWWWFGTCFIFHNIWDNPSHWLSYFSRWLKHVKTTNQCCFVVWPADVVIEPLLVGGLEHELYLSIQLGMSSSQLTNSIIFQRGWLKPPTRWLLYSPSLTIITISIDPYINSILTRVK